MFKSFPFKQTQINGLKLMLQKSISQQLPIPYFLIIIKKRERHLSQETKKSKYL